MAKKIENIDNSREDIGAFLRSLDPIFRELEGYSKTKVVMNFIKNMTTRLENFYAGKGNCLNNYYWNYTPCSIYFEDNGLYFKIDFYTGEVEWDSGDDE
jgi:hypothetical protein